MKAIASLALLMLSVTVAPVALKQQEALRAARAYPFADLGYRALEQGKWQEAAAAFRAAASRDPGNAMFAQMIAYSDDQGTDPSRIAVAAPRNLPETMAGMAAPPLTVRISAPRWSGPVVSILAGPVATAPQATQQTPFVAILPALVAAAPPAVQTVAAATGRDAPLPQQPSKASLADRLHVSAGIQLSDTSSTVAQGEALLGRGGSWSDVSVRLNSDAARPLLLAGFLYTAQSPGRLAIDRDSLQAGIGLRWQPVQGLTLEAARLLAIGKSARNDWMLRAGYGTGRWQDDDASERIWLHWQARGDVALVGLDRRDIFVQIDARAGPGFRLSDQLSLTPYAGITATLQKDSASTTLVDAGPGLWLHRGGAVPLDARLDWRTRIAGNSSRSSGLMLTLAASF